MTTTNLALDTDPLPWDIQKWSWVKYCSSLNQAVPNSSGVYIIAEVKRLYGLPASIEVVYVGRSVNLRRRYQEHLHLYEPNPGLSRLADKREGVEFWFLELPHPEIARIEQMLIHSLQPQANHIGIRAQLSQ